MTQDIKQQIKDTANIVEVIGKHISLTKKGVNHVGLCPFHQDNTASLIVSPKKQIYTCFACGATGDVFTFLMEHEHLSFTESMKYLAKKYSIHFPEPKLTAEEHRLLKLRESYINAVSQANTIYQTALFEHKEPTLYLQDREINNETISTFGIGYAPAGNRLLTLANQGKIALNACKDLLLIKQYENRMYDAFQNRITYPFYSLSGHIVGFSARALNYQKGDKYPKFINSSDSPLFQKGLIMYGLHHTKHYIARQDKAYLVEGQHDLLSLFQNGVKNVTAGSGTAFTPEQANVLTRFTQNITILYDGDTAGTEATEKAIQTLATKGVNVRVIALPQQDDPDSFARRHKENTQKELDHLEQNFVQYIVQKNKEELSDPFRKTELTKKLIEIISELPDKQLQKEYIRLVSELLKTPVDEITEQIREKKRKKPKKTKSGFVGIDEAKELMENGDKSSVCYLTFEQEKFIINFDKKPIILAMGNILKTDIQYIASKISEIYISDTVHLNPEKEDKRIALLKELFRNGIKITVLEESFEYGFVDYYVTGYKAYIQEATEQIKAQYVDRCAEIISYADNTVRTVMLKSYASALNISQTDLKNIIKPYLEKRKDRTILENQRLNEDENLLDFDPESVPAYVYQDENMKKNYQREGFFPILNKKNEPVSYMFKNEKGGGHTCISDFYMIPLLHIHSKDSQLNKRIVQLNHRHVPQRYVEWQSSTFATLGKVNEKLIEEGPYNFDGTMGQFKKIFRTMSYNFMLCDEMRIFGQQPEEFWAFANAIAYFKDGKMKVQYADKLGLTTYKDKHYYSPAFSEIYKSHRWDSDPYEEERFFVYRELPPEERIGFAEWAKLMDEVYKTNDNGKWAVLFDILACFRDFIFDKKRFFTTLFLIGPTSSGKTKLAESMRSLFMSPNAPIFNLNTGSEASFFFVLERLNNVICLMEEYNDVTISPIKFQGLKSAVLDGAGKTKVKDIANKKLDTSKINAIPVIIGQEAAQQDDGSLSNRSILCDVPYQPGGEWSEKATEKFDYLKEKELKGLSSVLLEILAIRPQVKQHYLTLFSEEVKKIKKKVNINVSNTEGLTRIINSVAFITAICRLVEENTPLKLPFTYAEFFPIACDKVIKQVEIISTGNKLSSFFQTISFLLDQGSIKYGREIKVQIPPQGYVTIKDVGNKKKNIILDPPNTKILYINLSSIYPLYTRAVKDPLSKLSLQTYFNSNSAYIGSCQSTRFTWYEEVNIPRKRINEWGEETGEIYADKQLERKDSNTSAYAFRYEKIVESMNIDFERQSEEENEKTKQKNKTKQKEDDKPF